MSVAETANEKKLKNIMTYFALAASLVFAALRPSSGPLWSRGPTWLLTIKTVEDKVSIQQKNIYILAFTA